MMDVKEHGECMRLTADVIERCIDGYVPDGFTLDERQRGGSWVQCVSRRFHPDIATRDSCPAYFRLVPIPQPKRIPHTRETWPGWRYVQFKDGLSDAIAVVEVSHTGVTSHDRFEISWTDLAEVGFGSNSHNGPWVELSQVVNE